MLTYQEHDNAQAVEIVLEGRVSTEEFDALAQRLEAFIKRHGKVRVLEIVKDFEGMDAVAFWHDIKFSLRHLKDLRTPVEQTFLSARIFSQLPRLSAHQAA